MCYGMTGNPSNFLNHIDQTFKTVLKFGTRVPAVNIIANWCNKLFLANGWNKCFQVYLKMKACQTTRRHVANLI
jgi:hypothetical protein